MRTRPFKEAAKPTFNESASPFTRFLANGISGYIRDEYCLDIQFKTGKGDGGLPNAVKDF